MSLSPSAHLEALLFAAGGPLTRKQLLALLELEDEALATVIADLNTSLTGRGLALVETSTEIELRTAPLTADTIRKLRESELSRDLGKASLETLAIILYRGTATRTEIDYVRGVNSGAALRALSLRGLIERSEDAADKRRARYRATVDALAHLGISRAEDLPRYSELSPMVAEAELRAEQAATTTDV
jgi:segregation and condensation protein B